ncbi:sterol desaturase family protein [Chitinophaga horti]|uniref:Sterol desaturase family protein n=1 Tax=Chitinophaga horti TaxID=2920382 RepID=A0ABY6IYT0_9BACT|nr:sterol desaturase family protein [Chitinophaga horti]UYQ92547.1 sterol desaturase family protein [Chitinophaga horti]
MQVETKVKNKGQARLFESEYLEILTKTHPLIIWGMYLPLIVWSLFYANSHYGYAWSTVLLTFVGAIFFWSFAEYVLHRFVFHMVSESKAIQRLTYLLHGNHHEYPRDRQRLFMPPVPSLILAAVLFALHYIFLRNATFMFFPGFILGYLIYGTMHYAIHAFNPPFKWMKPLWRNHHLHHYKDHDRGFGVSSSIWDHIFGTFFVGVEEDKEKAQELMFEKKAK